MKTFWIAFLIVISVAYAWAYRSMVIFDKTTGEVIKYFPQGNFHAPDYYGRDDVLFDVDLDTMGTIDKFNVYNAKVDPKYWKVNNDKVKEMSKAEKDAKDALDVIVSSK